MSMSTGDVRRPKKLSAKAAATDPPEAEVVDDAPQGGVLPVKKAAGRTTETKATGAKAAGTKVTGTKAAGATTTPAKAAPTKSAKAGGTKVTGGRSPASRPGGGGGGGGKNRKPLAPV